MMKFGFDFSSSHVDLDALKIFYAFFNPLCFVQIIGRRLSGFYLFAAKLWKNHGSEYPAYQSNGEYGQRSEDFFWPQKPDHDAVVISFVSGENQLVPVKPFPDEGDDAFFILFAPGLKGDAEANMRPGVVPRDGGDEVFPNHPLGEGFCIGEFDFSQGAVSCLGGLHVEEEGTPGLTGVKAG